MSLDEIEITAISHGGVKGTYIERSKTAGGRRGWEKELVSSQFVLLHAHIKQNDDCSMYRCDVYSSSVRNEGYILTDCIPMLSLNETLLNLVFLLERLVIK